MSGVGSLDLAERPSAVAPLTAYPSTFGAAKRVRRTIWRGAVITEAERVVPEEVPVALTCNGTSQAVLMATPSDLEDFAIGFSLTEGIVAKPSEIESLQIIPLREGIELRMWIAPPAYCAVQQRRRHRAGPTGCGLCGLESIKDAIRPAAKVRSSLAIPAESIAGALDELVLQQRLNRETRAVHAAAFCAAGRGLIVREDVGRHNALDKLAGTLAREGIRADSGFVLLSGRVSIDMVQKAAAVGLPAIVAISAPTALAVRACKRAGITLIGIAREDGFEVFARPERVVSGRWRRSQPPIC
jgi:FdhD protein